MQRILIAQGICLAFLVTGCQNGPWNLTTKEAPSQWDRSSLEQLVQSDDMDENLREADRLRAEREQAEDFEPGPEASSPNILAKLNPIDPAELTRKIQNERKKLQAKLKQAGAIPQRVSRNQTRWPRKTAAQTATSNPLQPKPQQLQPKTPAPQLVGHPLRPLQSDSPSENTIRPKQQMASQTQDDPDVVTIKQLPPITNESTEVAKLIPRLPQREHPLTPRDPSDWQSTPSNQFENVRQVSYEQDDDSESTQDTAPKNDSAESNADNAVAQGAVPERDEFTDEDFYAAGWCKKPNCQDHCECEVVKPIANTFDDRLPGVLPVQLETEDGPQWDLPQLPVGLKPLRDVPTRLAKAEPHLPIPGQNSASATRLPVLDKSRPDTHSIDDALVLPANAVEEIDQFVKDISNAATNAEPTANEVRAAEPHAAPATVTPLTWRQQLQQTIELIEERINNTPDLTEQHQLRGKLELLRLLPSELDDQQQQYLSALTDLLQTTAAPGHPDLFETGQTLDQLRNAVSYLESMASMKVVNASFCTKVTGFGQFKPTPGAKFNAGQQVLVYCEIENHSSQPKVVDGQALSSTRLAGSFIVYDANQQVVQQDKFPVVEDLARQRRRDFYMHIPFTVGDLPPGHYTYQLMIDDVGGGKSASLDPTLQFEVQ